MVSAMSTSTYEVVEKGASNYVDSLCDLANAVQLCQVKRNDIMSVRCAVLEGSIQSLGFCWIADSV